MSAQPTVKPDSKTTLISTLPPESHEAFLIARDIYSIACSAFREAEDLYRIPRNFHSNKVTSSINFDLACDSYEDARIAYKKAYNAYMSPYLNNKEI